MKRWLYEHVMRCPSRWEQYRGTIHRCDRPRFHGPRHIAGEGSVQVEWWDEHAIAARGALDGLSETPEGAQ